MDRLLNILLILFIPVFATGQENEYKSKEQEEYYRKLSFEPFRPLSKNKILNYKNDFFSFRKISDFISYKDSLYLTPYQDSIFSIMFNQLQDDSIFFPEPQFIGKIEKRKILKHEKNGRIEAFIYTSYEYENFDFGESGIWVAFSENDGLNWEYFYTGIVQRQPLYVKWYSKAPLIKSDSELQIEAALLRQLTPFIHPGPGPTYELVKDGILLTLDLNTLRRDSDSDGLTDIAEAKFYTDPANKDTNGNGIPDNLDLNPRFSVPRTDRTVIYESVLNMEIEMDDTVGVFISSLTIPQVTFATDTTETNLIVTDIPDIHSIQPSSIRVIILTEQEYKEQKGLFKSELNSIWFSPLFKVDNEVDTYIFSKSIGTWGGEYLVRKTEGGWIIKMISMWIS